ncbi:winged helix-turn-helix transcriptional regulator [Isobaculum melis]|uniref:DNA-binding transcriptional regulator, HxlR family n=1 Tax=Isobaculum melis TaxID=142588 RepID=A0A1H9QSY0_9LACT|nr:helix-turn-helix domain-containing protein [Isobaculum melis]SER63345.1 DNA-binding transcriptional regulator, HxlR family [Isobaculum melis]
MEKNICGVKKALSVIGGKWRIDILWHLAQHSNLRYNALKRALVGITNTTLNRSLNELLAYQLIHREQFDVSPPHVEYSLTAEGKKLIPVFEIINYLGLEMVQKKDTFSC